MIDGTGSIDPCRQLFPDHPRTRAGNRVILDGELQRSSREEEDGPQRPFRPSAGGLGTVSTLVYLLGLAGLVCRCGHYVLSAVPTVVPLTPSSVLRRYCVSLPIQDPRGQPDGVPPGYL